MPTIGNEPLEAWWIPLPLDSDATGNGGGALYHIDIAEHV